MAIFRLGRIGVTAAALAVVGAPLTLLVGAGPSGADTSPPTGGWYWAGQPGAQPAVGPPPAVPAPDVPAGDVAAAYRPTGVDKATFLHLAGEVASGTNVTSVVLTIKEDASAGNFAADQAKVNAKPVTDFWLDGAAGSSMDQAPKFDDTPSVAGTRGSDGTWTFDLTPIAQQWAGGTANNGVALIPDQSGGTFQVVWKLDTGAVAVESSGGSSSSSNLTIGGSGDSTGSASSPTSTATSDGSSTFMPDSGSSSTSSSSGGSLASLGGDTSTFTPATDPPAPSTASVPAAAPGATAPAGQQEVALTPGAKKAAAHSGLPAGFFLIGLVTLAVLGGIGVTLGDLGEPDVPREGSVVRRLERRVAPIR